MRRLLTLVVVAIVASSCAQTVNVDQEKAALMTADAEWSKVAKDIDKFVAYFTPDATMSMAGMPAMNGPKAIKDNMGPMMKAPGFDISWKATRAVEDSVNHRFSCTPSWRISPSASSAMSSNDQ